MKQFDNLEADYWDSHRDATFVEEPQLQKVRTKARKDAPITIRLSSEYRAKLEKAAEEAGVGPSTLVRMLVTRWLDQRTIGWSLEMGG